MGEMEEGNEVAAVFFDLTIRLSILCLTDNS
jgi:hypothetical protein